ncbi:MAG: hypothetical protein JO332_10440, partial [Planctomycetaceae bacterium]|nr:hypothetical protein [Planctomycetaceae bacterium]
MLEPINIATVEAETFFGVQSSGRTLSCKMGALGTDGRQIELVVKWRQGPERKDIGGICELIGALLARDLGFRTPKTYFLNISAEFNSVIGHAEARKKAQHSVGLNFSCVLLQPVHPWPKDRHIPMHHKQMAQEVFAFDALAENVDRRPENPNLLLYQDDIHLIDHDLAFS